MAIFESIILLTRPPADVFDFLTRPAQTILLAPPEMSLRLIEAPERLSLGAQVVIAGKRWGVSHRSTLEVTAFEAGKLLVEEQRRGPFRSWKLTQTLEEVAGGTRLTAVIDFEPPGGILGLTVTESSLRRELDTLFTYRAARLTELFGG